MSINNSIFHLDQLNISNLNKIKIDFSLGKSQGRRFTVSLDGKESEKVLFQDIFKKVLSISEKEKNIDHLNMIQTFLEDLKEIEDKAANESNLKGTMDLWYKINTWIHRLFQFGSHAQNIENLNKQLNTRLKTLDVDLESNRIEKLLPKEKAQETEILVDRLLDGNNLNSALKVIETLSSGEEQERLYLKVADKAISRNDLDTATKAVNNVSTSVTKDTVLEKIIWLSNRQRACNLIYSQTFHNQVNKNNLSAALVLLCIHESDHDMALKFANSLDEVNKSITLGAISKTYLKEDEGVDAIKVAIMIENMEARQAIFRDIAGYCMDKGTQVNDLLFRCGEINLQYKEELLKAVDYMSSKHQS